MKKFLVLSLLSVGMLCQARKVELKGTFNGQQWHIPLEVNDEIASPESAWIVTPDRQRRVYIPFISVALYVSKKTSPDPQNPLQEIDLGDVRFSGEDAEQALKFFYLNAPMVPSDGAFKPIEFDEQTINEFLAQYQWPALVGILDAYCILINRSVEYDALATYIAKYMLQKIEADFGKNDFDESAWDYFKLIAGKTFEDEYFRRNFNWQPANISANEPADVHVELFIAEPDEQARFGDWEPAAVRYIPWREKQLDESLVLSGHGRQVASVAFSPNGQFLASGSYDNTIRIWNLHSGTVQAFGDKVESVVFSPDGQFLASGSCDHTIRIWNLQNNTVREFSGHRWGVTSVAFSPNGQYVASGSYDNIIRIWDLQNNTVRELSGHGALVRSVAFSPNGQFLASGSYDNTIRIWNLQSGTVQALLGHGDEVRSVAFSPNGQFLASGSSDNTVRIWNLPNNTVQKLSGHGICVESVAFSQNGQFLASGAWDGDIRLWNLKNNAVRELSGHGAVVNSVAFSRDGQFLASGSDNRTVRIWDLRSIAYTPEQKLLILKIVDNYPCTNEMVVNLKKYVSDIPERARAFIQQRVPRLFAVRARRLLMVGNYPFTDEM